MGLRVHDGDPRRISVLETLHYFHDEPDDRQEALKTNLLSIRLQEMRARVSSSMNNFVAAIKGIISKFSLWVNRFPTGLTSADFFPFLEDFSHYKMRWLINDFSSGLVLSMLLLPQAIGYSLLVGVNPINGLISTAFAGLMYSVFGGSKHLVLAPEALTTVVLQHAIYDIYHENQKSSYLHLAIGLSFLSGLVFMIISFVRGFGALHYVFNGSMLIGFEAAIG